MSYGFLSLIPVLAVIVCALITRKAAESLLAGTVVGALVFAIGESSLGEVFGSPIEGDFGIWNVWFGTLLDTLAENVYYIIMFGMFGCMIRLLDNSGAALGFADIGSKLATSKKKTQWATFIISLPIFVDDYLNALGVGVAMRSLSDKFKMSRELLAWIVNSTGAALCVVVPISSWGMLYSTQLEETGLFSISGLSAYAKSVPFMFYTWLAVITVVLVIAKIIPLYGPMKKAELRAETTGRTYPDWYYEEKQEEETTPKKSGWWNFVAPMGALIAVAIITSDIVIACVVAAIVAAILLGLQKRLGLWEFAESVWGGFRDMFYVTALVMLAFTLQKFNDSLGLTDFVIDGVRPILSPVLFPMITFFVVALIAFATGSFWGVAAIAYPIILPLAQSMDVNMFLAVAAVADATAFGSHACFYSDAVTVTSAATGIRNIDYAKTSLPLIAIPFCASIVAFLIAGFVLI